MNKQDVLRLCARLRREAGDGESRIRQNGITFEYIAWAADHGRYRVNGIPVGTQVDVVELAMKFIDIGSRTVYL